MQIKTCRSCNHEKLSLVLDLGMQPWCNNFSKEEELQNEKKYPLQLMKCDNCNLLQLSYNVPKETMFKNHTYLSGTTKTLTKHFYDLAEENVVQFNLQETDLIVDIGGNDGTQMMQYQRLGIKNVLNIESADNIAKISIESYVPTINNYFNEKLIDDILSGEVIIEGNPFRNKPQKNQKAKLINASGVFFHLEELHSVCKGIKKLLDKNGIFIVQFMYAQEMLKTIAFDTIYHEHLCYYTIQTIQSLLKQYDIAIFDGYFSPIHSGSMVLKCCHKNSFINVTTNRLKKAYGTEIFQNLNENLKNFIAKVKEFSIEFESLIYDLIKQEKIIYCMGAPAKGNTLLNYCNLTCEQIKKTVEVNDLKIGLFTPGSHIPIVKEDMNDIPDYYILLSHNFSNEIMEKYKNKNVKFIIPFHNGKLIDIV